MGAANSVTVDARTVIVSESYASHMERTNRLQNEMHTELRQLSQQNAQLALTNEQLARQVEMLTYDEGKIIEESERSLHMIMENSRAGDRVHYDYQSPSTSTGGTTRSGSPQLQNERNTRDTQTVESLRSENNQLRTEVRTYKGDLKSLKSRMKALENDYKKEKEKHEKTVSEKNAAEEERKKIEMEKERILEFYYREKAEIDKRTAALKDVAEISKQMLVVRENQVEELKKKLEEIEELVSKSKLSDQTGLREEYEKQLQNIKTLKELYGERVRLIEVEKDNLHEKITENMKTIEEQKKEMECLMEQTEKIKEELKKEKSQTDSLERDLRLSIAKSKDLKNELSLMNNLFTQMLLGPYNTGNETDLDKLTELLQENHDLLAELILREDRSEIASTLPKLLLDLITQVDDNGQLIQEQGRKQILDKISEQSDSLVKDSVLANPSYKRGVALKNPTNEKEASEVNGSKPSRRNIQMNPAVQEIASNLPKVWRVLTELLSHHTVPEGPLPSDEKECYKYIETPTGTKSVISVSNTFIRLKDLILEKNALQKELTKLKQLNAHLENRLDDQGKRFSHVQRELHNTWGIVGRMRSEHQQLHNNERILKYELQEKRIMLSELKQELEYCRDKWERARQKNNESETQWQKLRKEFAARKTKNHPTAYLYDSGESGFSDEINENGEEAENYDADNSSTQSPVDSIQETLRKLSWSREKTIKDVDSVPGSSLGAIPRMQSVEDRIRDKEARLKRLEDQCQLLMKKVDLTTSKSDFLNNRLEQLHEQHGSTEEKTDAIPLDENPSCTEFNIEEGAAMAMETKQEKPRWTFEEILTAKNERLEQLEEQCQTLVGKMANTVQRGTDILNKLEDLHVMYVNSEKASAERQGNASAPEEPAEF